MFSIFRKGLNKIAQIGSQQITLAENQLDLSKGQLDLANALTDSKILLGKMLAGQNEAAFRSGGFRSINDFEFKVFSQFGDDGITQFLINRVEPRQQTFVEFGVQNYDEANTRFLLLNNNWKGLILDGDKINMDYVKKQDYFWRHSLTAVPYFLTRENINTVISSNGFNGDVGLLHVDLDGNDYWIWQSIDCVVPDILILEYNSVFGKENAWTVPYDPEFYRTRAHFSNLYWGASLKALCILSDQKGYDFVGCNDAGNNAFFIKKTIVEEKSLGYLVVDIETGYRESRFRESRNESGKLTFLAEKDRLAAIKGCLVFDVIKGQTVSI
jgi:hypothetical protein